MLSRQVGTFRRRNLTAMPISIGHRGVLFVMIFDYNSGTVLRRLQYAEEAISWKSGNSDRGQ